MRLKNEPRPAWVVVHHNKPLRAFEYSLCASRKDAIHDFRNDLQTPGCTDRHGWPWYRKRGYRCVRAAWCLGAGWTMGWPKGVL
jgi:hypothetical protein